MAGKVTRSVEERFWEKVNKTPRCWLWTAHGNDKGYGMFWVKDRNEFAQRVSWRLRFGEFNRELRVLHRCDNPACVRPDHLFLGTPTDNMLDRDRKGRQAKGERNGNRKLTEAKVRAIRRSTRSAMALARQYGIDVTHVWNIVKRRQWRHI